jgi:WD40 repeat protein
MNVFSFCKPNKIQGEYISHEETPQPTPKEEKEDFKRIKIISEKDLEKAIAKQLEEQEISCPVCLCAYNQKTKVPLVYTCGHSICYECHESNNLKFCPLDKKEVGDNPPKNFTVLYLIEKVKMNLTNRIKIQKELICERYKNNCTPQETLKTGSDITIKGGNEKVVLVKNYQNGECFMLLTGHSDTVLCILNLEDGLFASGSMDMTIKIWDYKAAECMRTLVGHRDYVYCLVKLESKLIASGSWDHRIKIWNYTTGECVGLLKGHSDAVYCMIKLNNTFIASGGWDDNIKIWDYSTKKSVKTINQHNNWVNCLLYLEESLIASGSLDDTVKISDYLTGELKRSLIGHSDSVECILLLEKSIIASGSKDKSIKIWNYNTGECLKTISENNSIIKCLLKLNTDEFCSVCWDDTIKIYKLENYQVHKTFHVSSNVFCLAKLNDCLIASGSEDEKIRIWNFQSGKSIGTVNKNILDKFSS